MKGLLRTIYKWRFVSEKDNTLRMLNDCLPVEQIARCRLRQNGRTTKCTDTGLFGQRLGNSQIRIGRSASGRLQSVREYALNHLRTLCR